MEKYIYISNKELNRLEIMTEVHENRSCYKYIFRKELIEKDELFEPEGVYSSSTGKL